MTPGDGVGTGDATNPDGSLFGVSNSTTTVMAKYEKGGMVSFARSAASWVIRHVKRYAGLQRRQATSLPDVNNATLRAIGVEFAANASSPRQNITASNEVIVSAGAIHTPQLLKLSGIGPTAELQTLSIPVLVDLPGVGTNLQDHPLVGVYCKL